MKNKKHLFNLKAAFKNAELFTHSKYSQNKHDIVNYLQCYNDKVKQPILTLFINNEIKESIFLDDSLKTNYLIYFDYKKSKRKEISYKKAYKIVLKWIDRITKLNNFS